MTDTSDSHADPGDTSPAVAKPRSTSDNAFGHGRNTAVDALPPSRQMTQHGRLRDRQRAEPNSNILVTSLRLTSDGLRKQNERAGERLHRLTQSLESTEALLASRNNELEQVNHTVAEQSDHLVALRREVEEVRNERDAVTIEANTDKLTGLANRRGLAGRWDQLMRDWLHPRSGNSKPQDQIDRNLYLEFIDLDGFKQINDRYGHDVGDAVLEIEAKRLTNAARAQDVITRPGGDELIIAFTAKADEVANSQAKVADKHLRLMRIAPDEIFLLAASLTNTLWSLPTANTMSPFSRLQPMRNQYPRQSWSKG